MLIPHGVRAHIWKRRGDEKQFIEIEREQGRALDDLVRRAARVSQTAVLRRTEPRTFTPVSNNVLSCRRG
jgi:hypothetical protein